MVALYLYSDKYEARVCGKSAASGGTASGVSFPTGPIFFNTTPSWEDTHASNVRENTTRISPSAFLANEDGANLAPLSSSVHGLFNYHFV